MTNESWMRRFINQNVVQFIWYTDLPKVVIVSNNGASATYYFDNDMERLKENTKEIFELVFPFGWYYTKLSDKHFSYHKYLLENYDNLPLVEGLDR